MKIILMRLRITIVMLEIRNRETLQLKVNICKSDVKIGDYDDSLLPIIHTELEFRVANDYYVKYIKYENVSKYIVNAPIFTTQ